MKSFKLPKKNKFKNYLKLFFTLNLLFGLGALGLFFYFSYEKNNPLLSALSPFFSRPTDSEVLSIQVGPQPLVKITRYDFTPQAKNDRSNPSNLENRSYYTIGGVDNGAVLQSLCSNVSNKTSFNVSEANCSGFDWSNSPPIIEGYGDNGTQEPILFFYGGMYHVKSRNQVKLISRFYSSTTTPSAGGSYDTSCNRSWFPHSVVRDSSHKFYFGNSALSTSGSNCFPMNGANFPQRYTQGDNWNNFANPWHYQYQISLKRDSQDVSIDKVVSYSVQSRQGYSINNDFINPSHKTYCFGKDLNGKCRLVSIYKEDDEYSQSWYMVSEGDSRAGYGFRTMDSFFNGSGDLTNSGNPAYIGGYQAFIRTQNCSEPNVFGLGTKRNFWSGGSECMRSFAGFEMPVAFYTAYTNYSSAVFNYNQGYSSANITSVLPYPQSGNPIRTSFSNRGELAGVRELYSNRMYSYSSTPFVLEPTQYGSTIDSAIFSKLDSRTIADYSSDAYYFKTTYDGANIEIWRFGLSEISATSNLPYLSNNSGYAIIPNVGSINLRNISFNVNGRGDLDIMFAPESNNLNSNSRSRIFRIEKFNHVNGIASARPVVREMTDQNNGYGFTSSGAIGVEAPLTVKYINAGDTNLTDDYAVFASRYLVWTSNIPYDCAMNNVTATFLTNPNSRLNGVVVPTNGSTSYNLGFSISPEPVITCGGTNLPIAGYTLQLIDPLSLNTIPTRNLTSVGNLTNPSFSNNFDPAVRRKWNLKLFAYTSSNTSIQIPIRVSNSESDINGNFSYIEEGSYQLRVFKDIGNGLTAPHNGAVFSISQTILTTPSSIVKSPITVNLGLSNTIFLNSSGIAGFFNDHWLYTLPNTSISDRVTNRICFIPQNPYQTTNMKIKSVSSPADSLISLSRQGNLCFNFSNVRNSTGPYEVKSGFIFNSLLEGVDAPPASVVTTDLRNVSFNSNVVNLKQQAIKGENYTSRNIEGNYLYRYSSASSSNFNKKYELSSSSSQFFEFSIRYTIPTSTPNFSSVNPSGCNSASFGMLNVFNSSQECSLGLNSSILSGPNLKILFVNNGTIKVDLNASLPSQLPIIRNTYLIDNNPSRVPGTPKISFALNCDTNPTPFLCLSGNRYFISGGLYRNVRFDGRLQSSQQNDIKMTVSQTGDVLPTLQHHLHRNKIPEIAIRKVILKYK